MKLVGYTRVSRIGERDVEMLRSPDQQRNAIEAYANNNPSGKRYEIVWLEPDLDESGKNLDRPSMAEALDMIRAGKADGIIAARLDRITRSVSDLDYLMKASKSEGWNLIAIDLGLDPSTANGQMIWQMLGAINEWYLNRSRENWSVARGDAIKRGHHIGAHPPFGYRKRADGRLEPDPVTAPIVKEIFARRAGGQSLHAIRDWARDTGVRFQFGGGWDPTKITRIMKNEVYLGVLRDKASGSRLEGAHPPLVDPAVFAVCQRRRGVRRPKTEENVHLLAGLLRCGGCRYTMFAHQASVKEGGRWYYACAKQGRTGDCPAPAHIQAVNAPRKFGPGIENWVVEQVFARLPDDDITMRPFGTDTGVGELAAAVQSAKAELIRYANDPELENALGRDAFLAGAQARRLAVETAEQAYADALREHGEGVPEKTRQIRADWDQMTRSEQREALSTVISAIFVREKGSFRNGASQDRVHIVWADDPEVDVPRQGRRDWVHPTPFVFPADSRPRDAREAAA